MLRYPTRFVSKKTGMPGYAPACSNKFVPGVCELPKVKCSDCTRQAFKPVDDAAVIAHLKGQHVMGVYPRQDDESCWFLAVYFDKSAWMDDVRAFVQTSRRLGLPLAVKRSRSGSRAHVVFLCDPRRGSDSSQDGMPPHHRDDGRPTRAWHGLLRQVVSQPGHVPRVGFGNLIALPLQHGPRQEGNAVFLNGRPRSLPRRAAMGSPRVDQAHRRVDGGANRIRRESRGKRRRRSFGERCRRRGRCTVDAATIREGAITAQHRTPPESSVSGALAEALRGEGRFVLAAAQPDQAYCRLPESGVLPEAEHAPVDGAHPTG